MKYLLLCLSIHCLINSQQDLNNFTYVLPLEITTIVFEKIPCTSLNEFYKFLMIQSVSKEMHLIIQSIEQKKWYNGIQYLFDNDEYRSLERIKSAYLPDVYQNIFISLFLENSVQNNKKFESYIQKMKSIREKTSEDRLLEQNICNRIVFFNSLKLPSELERRLEPFATNNLTLFDKNCNQEYMYELLFVDSYMNGLKMCIKRNHFHIFQKAYNYAMESAVLSNKKYLERDKIKLSKNLLILAAKKGNDNIVEYIYNYLKKFLLKDYSNSQKLEFFYGITNMICTFKDDLILRFIFQDLENLSKDEI